MRDEVNVIMTDVEVEEFRMGLGSYRRCDGFGVDEYD